METSEWRRGWRVVLGAALAGGFGIPLFYYVFSLFLIGMSKEFGVSRGEMSNVQALIVVGALFAPLVGKLLDRRGFAWVFCISTLGVVAGHILMATSVSSIYAFAAVAFLYGAFGIGCGPLVYTRPITAWFQASRGLALGLTSLGLAVTAAVAPPLLARLVEEEGWRAGFRALAMLAGGVALPMALLLIRDSPTREPAAIPVPLTQSADRSFFHERDFRLLALALFLMAVPGAGLVSQISPLVQEEGIGATMAALGVTAYAVGQVLGRIVAGWCLDRMPPQRVGFFFTIMPAIGFILLGALPLPAWLAIVAVGMVGVQQGAEIDLFAYFISRRFGLARYGTIYGWILAGGWIGNAAGILTFGWLHDVTGNYSLAEGVAALLMAAGAVAIAAVRADPKETGSSDAAAPQ